ncbi:hypothetical protein J8C07_14710 [Chloracidobacterium sp. S]|uniref:hypothetical protein n=1 Tax=Chloracidobacterium aggregatum TaxID=2851959 RepID=UPI001B8CC053|nr:hypothetical protein [Chloracidobacterium aggregatum]QUV89067.1 hypothetical protein J8C07_14710 [Chloracidobacterium sp. S]
MAQSETSSTLPASNPRRTLLIVVICFLGFVMVLAYSLPSRSLFGASGPKAVQPVPADTVIARVGSRTVTAKEYTDALNNLVAMYRRYAEQLASGGAASRRAFSSCVSRAVTAPSCSSWYGGASSNSKPNGWD